MGRQIRQTLPGDLQSDQPDRRAQDHRPTVVPAHRPRRAPHGAAHSPVPFDTGQETHLALRSPHTLINSQETCFVSGLAAATQIGADYPFSDTEARRNVQTTTAVSCTVGVSGRLKTDLRISCISTRHLENGKAVLDSHFLADRESGVEHFVERHELGLRTEDEYVQAIEDAGLSVECKTTLNNTLKPLFVGIKPIQPTSDHKGSLQRVPQ